MSVRSSLARHAGAMRDPDPKKVRQLAREAFHSTGLIVLDPAWVQSWGDRELIKAITAKVHGKPKG